MGLRAIIDVTLLYYSSVGTCEGGCQRSPLCGCRYVIGPKVDRRWVGKGVVEGCKSRECE